MKIVALGYNYVCNQILSKGFFFLEEIIIIIIIIIIVGTMGPKVYVRPWPCPRRLSGSR